MPIFSDSYQTSLGSAFVTKEIVTAIKESIIKDNINKVTLNVTTNGKFKPLFITGIFDSENQIPLFTHPITIFNSHNENYLATDMRLFIRKDTTLDKLEDGIKNLTEYNFTKSRAILSLLWLNDGINSIKTNLSFSSLVFSSWISETISKAFALDFKDQASLNVIAYYYHQLLFVDGYELTEDQKQLVVSKIIKNTKHPSDFVFKIVDRITPIKNIEDFCFNVVNILENVRLEKFNLVTLLTIVKNSWYGANAKEIISVALEHPPTFAAIVYTALSEKTFKNSTLYKIAERFGKRGASDEFTSNYISLVRSISIAKEEGIVFKPFEE